MIFKQQYSISAGLELQVRQCDDGVLVFEGISGTTHFLSSEAWQFFLSVSSAAPPVITVEAEIEGEGEGSASNRIMLIAALERAGLVSKC